jgi:diaminohydroxyphosphoribosylaminopyrimidine deaminase/5-amino-6-(5-phosphoribosylamino)uracil reductase
MVGAVVVHQGKIIGEGVTSPFGGAHAEVNAIASVTDKSLLAEATLYVALEPCSHFGKTPPCADLIVREGIPQVVVGVKDPHKKVAGKGIARLREAGCEVIVGVLEAECRDHFKRFLCFQEKKRPYIILKWAQSSDGFLAPDPSLRKVDAPYWISSPASQRLVHQWRAQEMAILVGTRTVMDDNPALTVRHVVGKHPLRVVIDVEHKLSKHASVFSDVADTLVLVGKDKQPQDFGRTSFVGIDRNKELLPQLSAILYERQINSIIIEGGAYTLQQFIDQGLWDEARVFTGTRTFEKGVIAPSLPQNKLVLESKSGTDRLTQYNNV